MNGVILLERITPLVIPSASHMRESMHMANIASPEQHRQRAMTAPDQQHIAQRYQRALHQEQLPPRSASVSPAFLSRDQELHAAANKQHNVILQIFVAEILQLFHLCLSPAMRSRYAVRNDSEFFHIQCFGPSCRVYPRFLQHSVRPASLESPSDSRKGIVAASSSSARNRVLCTQKRSFHQ